LNKQINPFLSPTLEILSSLWIWWPNDLRLRAIKLVSQWYCHAWICSQLLTALMMSKFKPILQLISSFWFSNGNILEDMACDVCSGIRGSIQSRLVTTHAHLQISARDTSKLRKKAQFEPPPFYYEKIKMQAKRTKKWVKTQRWTQTTSSTQQR
jgi:hypothetical protein